MSETKLSNRTIGNIGEYYVAAELERRNFTTSVVGNNCNDYDIIAVYNVKPYKTVLIQVKTSSVSSKKWLTNSNYTQSDNLFYVFVSIKDKEPKYYILSSKEAVRLKEEHLDEFCKNNGYNKDEYKDPRRDIILNEKHLSDVNNWQMLVDYCIKERG